MVHSCDMIHLWACLLAICGQSSWRLAKSGRALQQANAHADVWHSLVPFESAFVTVMLAVWQCYVTV